MFLMSAKPKASEPRRDEATRPSASPADGKNAGTLPVLPDLSSEDKARALNRENRQDEVLFTVDRFFDRLQAMPEWQQKMDIAKLAVEIARSRPDMTPQSCIREASELMLAAADEMEWMRHGKAEEERRQRDEKVEQGLIRARAVPLPAEWAELVPWELLCCEDKVEKPETLTFPDGVEFEAYSRANKLKERVAAWLDGTGDLKGWMKKARSGKLRKIDLHPLALFRQNGKVSNKIVEYWHSQPAPDETLY